MTLNRSLVFGLLLCIPPFLLAQTPTVEQIANLPPIAAVELSPDGSNAVMLRAKGETYHVYVLDLEQKRSKPGVRKRSK
ncbi:MAG: hypothetical protein O3A63_08495 [Proteobacteria bacterium]|nr:hypothetical protein [Pseudomonadota bacterium]